MMRSGLGTAVPVSYDRAMRQLLSEAPRSLKNALSRNAPGMRALLSRTALVGVMKQSVTWASSTQSHFDRSSDQALVVDGAKRPSDNEAGIQVEKDGEVQPTIVGAEIRRVSRPRLIWSVRLEVSVENVGCDRLIVLGHRRVPVPASSTSPQPLALHEANHAFATHSITLGAKIAEHARVPYLFRLTSCDSFASTASWRSCCVLRDSGRDCAA